MKICVQHQNSSWKRASLVTTGLDAEEALRLHEDHHQQKRPAQVQPVKYHPLIMVTCPSSLLVASSEVGMSHCPKFKSRRRFCEGKLEQEVGRMMSAVI